MPPAGNFVPQAVSSYRSKPALIFIYRTARLVESTAISAQWSPASHLHAARWATNSEFTEGPYFMQQMAPLLAPLSSYTTAARPSLRRHF